MGASASIFHVVNKAVYDIQVDLYKPKDIEGMSVVKQYSLLPGETKAIKVEKGANIRISGNGRTEVMRAVTAGEVLEINRVRRAKPVRSMEDLIPAQPSTTPVATESRAEYSGSDEDESRRDWIDFKNRTEKDELQQLTRKLEREQLQKRQAELLERQKQQEHFEAGNDWQRLNGARLA